MTLGRDERWQTVPDSGGANWMHDALVSEWTAFVRMVDHDAPSPVPGEYARHIMATVFRGRRVVAFAPRSRSHGLSA